MILLTSTSDVVNLVTSAATTVEVHASYVDINGATVTPGRKNTSIAAATTTEIVESPAASTSRNVKTIQIRNCDTATTQTIDVIHTDGTTAVDIFRAVLAPNWSIHYDYAAGWTMRNHLGLILPPVFTPPGSDLQFAVLGSDVTNDNASANTMQDVTGLSFTATSGTIYWFQFNYWYTAASTATGSRWAINGPANDILTYRSESPTSATARSVNEVVAYDFPAASSSASGATAGNIAIVEGFIRTTATGAVIGRFASEVASSAIVAKQGSNVRWIAVG